MLNNLKPEQETKSLFEALLSAAREYGKTLVDDIATEKAEKMIKEMAKYNYYNNK